MFNACGELITRIGYSDLRLSAVNIVKIPADQIAGIFLSLYCRQERDIHEIVIRIFRVHINRDKFLMNKRCRIKLNVAAVIPFYGVFGTVVHLRHNPVRAAAVDTDRRVHLCAGDSGFNRYALAQQALSRFPRRYMISSGSVPTSANITPIPRRITAPPYRPPKERITASAGMPGG